MESHSSMEESATTSNETNDLVSPPDTNETIINVTSSNSNQSKNKLWVEFKRRRKHKQKSATTKLPQNNNLDNAEEKPIIMINECAICMMSFHGKRIGTPQHCKHNFCFNCLKKWSEIKSSCPLDRKKFNWIAVRKEIGGKVVKKVSCFKKLKRNNPTEVLTQSELFTIGYALNNFRSQITHLGGLP